jgi:TATA-box binding protein (TBP) (component of TFIID and TFIIIB)
MSHLVFPEFDDIPVSTKTVIVKLNLKIDLEKMVQSLPYVDYVIVPKRRGRKKKDPPPDPNRHIESGSIITLQFKDILRGVDLKQRKKETNKNTKKRGFFRNAATVVMIIDGKIINFKVCNNGKFQMTGCKSDAHAEAVVKYMWDYIKQCPDVYTFDEPNTDFEAIIVPAMRNIDFSLGFYVNREELDSYINDEVTEWTSLLETSFGYTGVNIKVPMEKDIRTLNLKKLICKEDDSKISWDSEMIGYDDFLDTLTQKEKDKKLNKERNNTFLVFHSGKVIMSGICTALKKDVYYEFLDVIRKCYEWIEERLDDEFEDRPRRPRKNIMILESGEEEMPLNEEGYYDWENEPEVAA